MLNLFVELWNAAPDDWRIPAYALGRLLLFVFGGSSCRYYEDASIDC